MDNYEKHLDAGECLGKKGDELKQYVQKRAKQDDERAEREFKRQLDSEERRASMIVKNTNERSKTNYDVDSTKLKTVIERS